MNIGKCKKVLAILAAAAVMMLYGVAEAQAGWGSFGSRGGSWGGSSGGSWGGSSGGSWGSRGGSWGSRGGSWGSRGGGHFARHRARHARRWGSSGGSSGGSWGGSSGGSSGGSWGGSSGGYSRGYTYYSASSGGSSGGYNRSYGSSGGSWGGSSGGRYIQSTPVYSQPSQPVYSSSPAYSTPSYSTPIQSYPSDSSLPIEGTVVPPGPTPAAPIDGGQTPFPGPERTNTVPDPVDGTEGTTDTAFLNLEIPDEAVVYVNGRRTSTPGNFRRFVSKNLKDGKDYTYEVKAELERDGQILTRTRVVQLSAGDNKTFEMDFDDTRELLTSVTLFVPQNAKVSLGGVETRASGPMRYFSTTKLTDGQSWDAYNVVVTVERDGKTIRREKTIDVNAGDSVNLRFDFDSDAKVATR